MPLVYKIEGLKGLYESKSDLYQDIEWRCSDMSEMKNRRILFTSVDAGGNPIWAWDGEWTDDYIKNVIEWED